MARHPAHDIERDDRRSGLSRRFFIGASAASGLVLSRRAARAAIVRTDLAKLGPYGNGTLQAGIQKRLGRVPDAGRH